jgi:hypothetical protein
LQELRAEIVNTGCISPRRALTTRRILGLTLCVLGLFGGNNLRAQFQMPDPKQMSGIPRPVTDLPDGTVSVRLIRGDFSNNITDFPVEMQIGGRVRTARTDESGRAEFKNLPPGETVKVVAVVDGERLESEAFPAPGQGGIRLMLVATDKSKRPETEPGAPPVAGQVVLGSQSRIIIEPGDEKVTLYYLLDIVNNARVPVNPPAAFAFDMPAGAVGTGLLQGSSPKASVDGPSVRVEGPFAPGRTLVQVACELPVGSASLSVTQRFPAAFEQLAVIVKKLGDTKLASPQLPSQQEMTASGETFIAASGGAVTAGQAVELTLTNLPHHSAMPRWIALSLAGLIVISGMWFSGQGEGQELQAAEHKRLIGRRDKLFNELVRLEHDRKGSRVSQARYETRRQELVSALEQVYGALDRGDIDPRDPGAPGPNRSSLAA